MERILLECTLRGLVLAAAVWALLRLLRVHDARTELRAWTAVLATLIAMPLLTGRLQLEVILPTLPVTASTATLVVDAPAPAAALTAPAANPIPFLRAVYFLIAGALLLRLLAGLIAVFRLWRTSQPLGPGVRISDTLQTPVTCGSTVLVPAEFPRWDGWKQRAVLAHEFAHVQRGDFWVQLIAAVYRAVFWFHPLAWLLHARIARLAEDASDTVAIETLDDRARYAEVLLSLAAKQPLPALALSMARPATVSRRVERVLSSLATARTSLARGAALSLAGLSVALLSCVLQFQLAAAPSQDQPPPPPPPPPAPPARSAPKPPPPPPPPPPVKGNFSLSIQDKQVRFERDGKKYLIDDPATVRQIQEMAHAGQDRLLHSHAGMESAHAHLKAAQERMQANMHQLQQHIKELIARNHNSELSDEKVHSAQKRIHEELQQRMHEKEAAMRAHEMEQRALDNHLRAEEAQQRAELARQRAAEAQERHRQMLDFIDQAIAKGLARLQ